MGKLIKKRLVDNMFLLQFKDYGKFDCRFY